MQLSYTLFRKVTTFGDPTVIRLKVIGKNRGRMVFFMAHTPFITLCGTTLIWGPACPKISRPVSELEGPEEEAWIWLTITQYRVENNIFLKIFGVQEISVWMLQVRMTLQTIVGVVSWTTDKWNRNTIKETVLHIYWNLIL